MRDDGLDHSLLPEEPPSPHDEIFGDPPLPSWVAGFRPGQWEAICEVVEHFRAGTKVVFLDAATGAGKTLIGEAVRRLLRVNKALYLCTTLDLQDQFAHDFPYAPVLKGRSNHPTLDDPAAFHDRHDPLTAEHCTKRRTWETCNACGIEDDIDDAALVDDDAEEDQEAPFHCLWCHPWFRCPYDVAKQVALREPLASSNTAYFLREVNGPGQFKGRGLVVIDEADSLKERVCDSVEMRISPRRLEKLGMAIPDRKTPGANAWPAWSAWCEEAAGATKQLLKQLPASRSPAAIKERKSLAELRAKLVWLSHEILVGGWVLTDYQKGAVVFKPVWARSVAPDHLWRHGQRFLLMSATIISPEVEASRLGLSSDQWEVVTMPSLFPARNRPVFVTPTSTPVTHKTKDVAYPEIAEAIPKFLKMYQGQRILAHTHSYELAQYLHARVGSDRVRTYANATERAAALKWYRKTPGAVMLAPSWDRGIDLTGDDCRCILICKTPYPNLGDQLVSARFHEEGGEGNLWYAVETIRTIVQECGRGVRTPTDTCDTYILDRQFVKLWNRYRHLFPEWFAEAVRFEGGMRSVERRKRSAEAVRVSRAG